MPFSGPVIFLLSTGGYRQISTVTRFQAHPSRFLHWSQGPCSRAAGGSLLTGAILKACSAGGVSGSFGRSVLKPKLLVAGFSFVSCPALLHKLQVISKFPILAEHDCLFIDALTSSRNLRLIVHKCNGKSLSWMGLTRERWCCTRGLVSRLDMNTCQTSIKTDILL